MITSPTYRDFNTFMGRIMSDNIVDLDALVPADKRIAFQGKTYTVPGDLPLVTYLKLNRMAAEQEGEDVTEATLMDSMIEALVQLFAWKLSDDDPQRAELDTAFRGLGIDTITNMIGKIYPTEEPADAEDPVDADAADPQTEPDGETTTTS